MQMRMWTYDVMAKDASAHNRIPRLERRPDGLAGFLCDREKRIWTFVVF